MWRDVLFKLVHWGPMVLGILAARWLLELSTPRLDWQIVQTTVRTLWRAVQVPDWRESFNMERLEWLRKYHHATREYGYERANADIIIIAGTVASNPAATSGQPEPNSDSSDATSPPDVDAHDAHGNESRR